MAGCGSLGSPSATNEQELSSRLTSTTSATVSYLLRLGIDTKQVEYDNAGQPLLAHDE
jgi:hypothetical protein